jgi:hypothetical protein
MASSKYLLLEAWSSAQMVIYTQNNKWSTSSSYPQPQALVHVAAEHRKLEYLHDCSGFVRSSLFTVSVSGSLFLSAKISSCVEDFMPPQDRDRVKEPHPSE